ncbi:hypothetical protein ACI3L3_10270 [Desulfobaculum sp. SPO524]|uniref:hypothetical protein n=1 Tax=Desulfobaculum sp. SPO524 TaxID=3378071 RepID=UPI003854DD1D
MTTTSNAPARTGNQHPARQHNAIELFAMKTEELRGQVALIQNVMHSVMKNGEHFGVINGCGNKPILLKSGAEKLAMTFRLAPTYDIERTDLPNGHREYHIVATLRSIVTEALIGQGVGACSTTESKYRFRTQDTGNPVPKEYWDTRDPKILGGSQFSPRKVRVNGGQEWRIFERVEHDNPADYYNTCLKMAKKRALVDATLTATAASDIFTQDLEDNPGLFGGDENATPTSGPEPRQHPQGAAGGNGQNAAASDKQLKMIERLVLDRLGWDYATTVAAANDLNGTSVEQLSELSKRQASNVISALQANTLTAPNATGQMDDVPY